MFTKIQQGGTSYDLTVPSDYMIEKMKKANLLLPLDKSKLRGMQNMDPRLIDTKILIATINTAFRISGERWGLFTTISLSKPVKFNTGINYGTRNSKIQSC